MAKRVSSVSTSTEYKPDSIKRITNASSNVEYIPTQYKLVTNIGMMVEYTVQEYALDQPPELDVQTYTNNYDFGSGGFDLQFEVDQSVHSIDYDDVIAIRSSVPVTNKSSEYAKQLANVNNNIPILSSIVLSPLYSTDSGKFYQCWSITLRDTKYSEDVDKFKTPLIEINEGEGILSKLFRIVVHDTFITIYIDGIWAHTFCVDETFHQEIPTIEILNYSSHDLALENVRLKEIPDWREAIFIDLESTAENAISSVVSQRPLTLYYNYLGDLIVTYEPIRNTNEIVMPLSHKIDESVNQSASSDAIVQGTTTFVVNDKDSLSTVGFVTRLLRLPDLESGAAKAARVIQKRARQSSRVHSVVSRLIPQMEVNDLATINYTRYRQYIDEDFIVEQMTVQITDGVATMTIQGRSNAT